MIAAGVGTSNGSRGTSATEVTSKYFICFFKGLNQNLFKGSSIFNAAGVRTGNSFQASESVKERGI